MPHKDPEKRRAAARVASRKWRERNPERARQVDRDWKNRNRAAIVDRQSEAQPRRTETQRARRHADPAQNRMYLSRRRARKLAQFVEDVNPDVVYARDYGLCGICGTLADGEDFHVDHVIPLVHGGEHSYANTQTAHPRCNLKKGATL